MAKLSRNKRVSFTNDIMAPLIKHFQTDGHSEIIKSLFDLVQHPTPDGEQRLYDLANKHRISA